MSVERGEWCGRPAFSQVGGGEWMQGVGVWEAGVGGGWAEGVVSLVPMLAIGLARLIALYRH